MQGVEQLVLRPLLASDAELIAAAFASAGFSRRPERYLEYIEDERQGVRLSWVAFWEGDFAGHVTLHLSSLYTGMTGRTLPEIQDLAVLPHHRRRGIATRLLDCAEVSAAARSSAVAIG